MKHSFTKRIKLIAMAIVVTVSGAVSAQEWQEWNTEGTDGVTYSFRDLMTEEGFFTLDVMVPRAKMEIIDAGRNYVMHRYLVPGENRFDLNVRRGPYLCAITTDDVTHLEVLRIGTEEDKSLGDRDGILVYPNPSTDQVKMDIEKGEEGTLRILDMNGNVMSETQLRVGQNVIEVGEYPKGFYIAEYVTEKGIQQETLIKE